MIDTEGNLWLHQNDMIFNCHKQLEVRQKHLAFQLQVTKEGSPPNDAKPTDFIIATATEIQTLRMSCPKQANQKLYQNRSGTISRIQSSRISLEK
jgi:predicted FMN-binding regulatory protein PaiB